MDFATYAFDFSGVWSSTKGFEQHRQADFRLIEIENGCYELFVWD